MTPADRLEFHLSKVRKQMTAIAAGKRKMFVDIASINAELHQTLPEDPDAMNLAPEDLVADADRWLEAIESLSPTMQQLVRRVKEHTKGGAGLTSGRQAGRGKDMKKLGRRQKGKTKGKDQDPETEVACLAV